MLYDIFIIKLSIRDLNNDSYNYALEYYGYPRISNVLRINRNIIDVDKNKLENIDEFMTIIHEYCEQKNGYHTEYF